MESLALLVAIMFLINLLAGPIAIVLTWQKIIQWIAARSHNVSLALTILRRIIHGLLIAVGFLIGGWLTYAVVTPAKLFGVFSLITSYVALRREYFPDFQIGKMIRSFITR